MAQTFGYARVSTLAQNLDAQVDTPVRAGVDERCIVVEHGSGRRDDRPALGSLLDSLRPGDTLVVTKLDRLGRSTAWDARPRTSPSSPPTSTPATSRTGRPRRRSRP